MRRFACAILWLALAANAFAANFTVTNVASLATSRPGDGDVVTTLGYSTVGVGANSYYYDADSTATVNGGTVINGPGGIGRYHALDTTRIDVTQFGADKTGVISSTTAIQAAIDATPENGVLYLPEGRYLHGTLTITQGLSIRGPGVLVHTKDDGKISVEFTWGASVACTVADQAFTSGGSAKMYTHKLGAVGHGLVKGEYIKVVRATATAGEIAQVIEVVDADSFNIDHKLEEIAASDANVVYYAMPTDKLDIEINVDSDRVDGNWPASHGSLEVFGAIHPRIVVRGGHMLKTGVLLRSVVGGSVHYSQRDNGDALNTTNAANRLGYGVIVASGTRGTRIELDVSGGRHGFSTGSDLATIHYGDPADVVVSGIVRNANSAAFDTHADGRRIKFQNCNAQFSSTFVSDSGTLPIGFQNRSKDTIYQSCTCIGGRRGFELGSSVASSVVTMQGIRVENTTNGGIVCNEATTSMLLIDGYYYRDTATSTGSLGHALAMYNTPVKLKNATFIRGASASQAIRINGTGATCVLDINGLDYTVASGGPAPILYSSTSGTATVRIRNYVNVGTSPVTLFRVEAGTLSYRIDGELVRESDFTGASLASLFGAGAVASLNQPTALGNSGATETVNWSTLKTVQTITLDQNCTLTFTTPPSPQYITLIVVQNGTGTYTLTWPTINWKAGALQPDATASATSMFQFYYDGAAYHEVSVNN